MNDADLIVAAKHFLEAERDQTDHICNTGKDLMLGIIAEVERLHRKLDSATTRLTAEADRRERMGSKYRDDVIWLRDILSDIKS